jgi:adenosine deaminase
VAFINIRPFAILLALCCCHAAAQQRGSIDQRFNELRKSPPELYAFLLRMPKGADLHNHVAGAVYAETMLQAAAQDHACIDTNTFGYTDPPANGTCPTPAARAETDNYLANSLIDSLSMRDFVPGRESAHDHFFASFAKFQAAAPPEPASFVAEVIRRAAEQNESYLELMALVGGGPVLQLGRKVGFTGDFAASAAQLREAGIADAVASLKTSVDELEKSRLHLLNCQQNPESDACRVTVRYIYQVLREFPNDQVFAQTLAGFMLASIDPRVVAVNFVQPEDGLNSMRNYHLHMQMVDYLKTQFPSVRLTLHAGELASGLVPPEGLRFHIREAIDLGHAERIGHGVDIMYEQDALGLLAAMKKQNIAVEINLTSNDLILGVSGYNHPFPVYRKFGVPVTLNTDDEGVSRTHLTQEYQRAVLTYSLSYSDVKQIVRNGLQYSFLRGEGYWTDATYREPAKACQGGRQTTRCRDFLAANEKARLQADLEERFQVFEKSLP